MGLFDLFKKENKNIETTTDNGVAGPTFFDGLTAHISNPKKLKSFEWRRQLKTPEGKTKFKIRFYGNLHEEHTTLIVGTDYAPSLIFAVEPETGKEILLFDGCKHGYNAMFCDNYSQEQIENRPCSNVYKDKDGNELFECILSTYIQFDYDEEMGEEVDDDGFIELIDGSKVEFEIVKRNGYDCFQLFAINQKGETIEVVSEELA